MNAIDRALRAYGEPQSPLRTGRQAEHQVFSTVTARLAAAARRPENFAPLAAALHDNRRLWTRLAVDVADRDNGLPQDLRARIFYLAEFTHVHSQRVLAGETDAQVLVDINTAVMKGLGTLSAAPAPAQVPQ
jgi:flagellar protein FlaF